MKRQNAGSASVNTESSSSSVGSSNGAMNSLAGRPPFLSTSTTGTAGRRFHAASRPTHPQEGQTSFASQSLNSTLGLFPRAGASPVHSNWSRCLQTNAAASVAAPQPDRAGDVHVRIKTRDPTSASRRAAVKQSSGPGAHGKVGAACTPRGSNAAEGAGQWLPVRTRHEHDDGATLSSEATASYLPFTQQGSSPDSSAHHSRTFSLFSSLLPQQHLSPINETDLTNASLSSERVPREIGYDGCSDDSINGHVSALHALSPGVRRVDHVPLQPVSPVQGEVAAALDAHNRDSVIQNMDELIADAAPMHVSEEFLLLLSAPSFFFFCDACVSDSFPTRNSMALPS